MGRPVPLELMDGAGSLHADHLALGHGGEDVVRHLVLADASLGELALLLEDVLEPGAGAACLQEDDPTVRVAADGHDLLRGVLDTAAGQLVDQLLPRRRRRDDVVDPAAQLPGQLGGELVQHLAAELDGQAAGEGGAHREGGPEDELAAADPALGPVHGGDRKSTRLNSSHANISYAVFCLKKKKNT